MQALHFLWFKVNILEAHFKNAMERLVTHSEHAPKNSSLIKLLTVVDVIRRKSNFELRDKLSDLVTLNMPARNSKIV